MRRSRAVLVVDFDVGLRILDLVMGAECRVVYDMIDVVEARRGFRRPWSATSASRPLFLLPASKTREKDALTEEGVERLIRELRELRLGHP